MPGGVKPPFEVILTWKPNYVNPETRGPFANILFMTLLAICYLVVGLRIYARAIYSKTYGADDTLTILSLVPLTGMTVSMHIGMKFYGWDRHAWDVPLTAAYESRKIGMVVEQCFNLTSLLVKVSILLLYRRITSQTSRAWLWIIYGLVAAFVALAIAIAVGFTIQCLPVQSIWLSINPLWRLQHEGEYHCMDEGAFVTTLSVLNVVQDFIIYFLPMPVIVKLRITRREKIGLLLLFSIGFFLCICGILRTLAVVKTFYHTWDSTWAFYDAYLWAGVEANVAVIIGSLPALNHFFRRVFNHTTSAISTQVHSTRTWPRIRADSSFITSSRSGSRSNAQIEDDLDLELQRKGTIHLVQEFSVEKGIASRRKSSHGQLQHSPASGTVPPIYEAPSRSDTESRQTWWDPDTSAEELCQNPRVYPGTAM